MHLTGPSERSAAISSIRWLSAGRAWGLIGVGLLLVYQLDHTTGSAPVQHLYYLPIILAGVHLRMRGALAAAVGAIVLYHFANPHVLTLQYEEADIVQMALFGVVAAVTATLRHNAERLRKLAMTDDLTGLHNLRSFEERLRALLRASHETRTPLSLLVLDVDHLKSLNDAHGHLAGAEAVRTVGRLLPRRLPPDAVASRYGGDEFVVALPSTAASAAREIANDLRHAVAAEAPVLAGRSFPAATLSISIGLASFDPGDPWVHPIGDLDRSGEALFQAADRALYLAKANGRNRICASGPR